MERERPQGTPHGAPHVPLSPALELRWSASPKSAHSSARAADFRSANARILKNTWELCTSAIARSFANTAASLSEKKEICTFILTHVSNYTMLTILPLLVHPARSNKHIRALHEKSRPFPCPDCESHFTFQDGLSRHIAMVCCFRSQTKSSLNWLLTSAPRSIKKQDRSAVPTSHVENHSSKRRTLKSTSPLSTRNSNQSNAFAVPPLGKTTT